MRPTLTLLGDWNPASLAVSADELTVTVRRYRSEVTAGCERVRSTDWSGLVVDAACERADRELRSATALSAEMDRIAAALQAGAGTLAAARAAVFAVVDESRQAGLFVDDTGRVTAPPPAWLGAVPTLAAVVAVAFAVLARVQQERLSAALDAVDAADRDLAAALRRTGSSDTDRPPAPSGFTPEQNCRYWSTLRPAQQRAAVDEYPDRLGNLDGIPGQVRDEINRSRLAADRRTLEERIAQLRAAEPDGDPRGSAAIRARAEFTATRDRLAELDAVARSIADPGRRLLVYRNEPRLRAAVAVGDVDTADHVAVFTPGVDSTVGGDLERYADDAAVLGRDAAGQLTAGGRGGETVATVAWLDYLPPQTNPGSAAGLVGDLGAGTAGNIGGAALSEFYRGIAVSRPDDVHLTALGHSYGSTTTGLALQRRGTVVDDAVFFGSPGLATRDVRDLGVPPGHVFVAEAPGDLVADLGAYGTDPNRMAGVTNLSTAADNGRSGSSGHSGYLTPGSTSLHNIGAVVAGLPGNTVTGTDAGLGDSLPAGIGDSLRGSLFGDPRGRWLDETPHPSGDATP